VLAVGTSNKPVVVRLVVSRLKACAERRFHSKTRLLHPDVFATVIIQFNSLCIHLVCAFETRTINLDSSTKGSVKPPSCDAGSRTSAPSSRAIHLLHTTVIPSSSLSSVLISVDQLQLLLTLYTPPNSNTLATQHAWCISLDHPTQG
jgi:hypothetical protein